MSKRPRNQIVDRNNEAADRGRNADLGNIRTEEFAYEAIIRALRSRWLAIDWDIHTLLLKLKVQLRVSDDMCHEIHTKLKREFLNDNRPQIPAPDHRSQVHNISGGTQRHVFTEHELRAMETSAYEAVDRAFRQEAQIRQQLVMSDLRDLFRKPEDHQNKVSTKLQPRVKIRLPQRKVDDDQIGKANDSNVTSSYVSERKPLRYRSIIELSYGSFEEWERRKLTLVPPDDRKCRAVDTAGQHGICDDEERKPNGGGV